MVLTRGAVARQSAGQWSPPALAETKTEFDSFPMVLHQNTATSAMRKTTKAAKKRRPSPPSSPSPCNNGIAPPRRRPTRPVDRRQKMLAWLVDKLDGEEMPRNLWWQEKGRVFSVKWPHAASQKFSSKEDARLFKAWAEHSGLHVDGEDEPDHKKWKANFRCALHSLPNVKEITVKESRKGLEAARIYRILDEPEPKKARSRKSHVQVSEDEIKGEDSDSGVSTVMDNTDSLPLTVACMLETQTDNSAAEESSHNLPDFKSLGVSCIQPRHMSGGCMLTKEEFPPPSTSPVIVTSVPLRFPAPPPTTPLNSSASFPCTSTTSSSFTFPPLDSLPVPTTTIPPQELVDEQMMMRPVAIRVTTPRGRTPSGDSGVPGSPPLEAWGGEEGHEELVPPAFPEGVSFVEIPDDEINGVMHEIEVQGPLIDLRAGEFVDISQNAPEPVVAMEITTDEQEDYKYTSLDGQYLTLELL